MSSVKVLTKKNGCCCKICLTASLLITSNNVTSTVVVAVPTTSTLVPSMTVSPTGTYAHISYSASLVASVAGTITHQIMVNGSAVATFIDEFNVTGVERTISYTYLYTGPGPLASVSVNWSSPDATAGTTSGTNRTLAVLSYS